MPLAIGTTLGPYEILALIGSGGMGEVYRARDPRTGRDVAIKVSSERFSERFDREVRAVAALNHPNICALYDVGPNYLVMELVEGPTLAERIKQGPIPLEEALGIARQIGAALEAADESTIVHRDLKPANIKIKADGMVKVLDFGLAKLGGTPAANAGNSPTLSLAETQAGVILGTAAYMSPEQARGQPVDRRADIWAFGVVLYEMLTGRQLFQGDTISDTLAAVLRQEPELERVPAKVRRLLKSCLEKDPKRRLRDIGDAWRQLEEAPEAKPATQSKLLWAVVGALAVFLGVALWGWWRATRPIEQALRPLVRLDVDLGPDVSLGSVAGAEAVLSPDGTRLVYVSQGRLLTRRLEQANATELAGTQGAFAPFFSPDGRWVAFFAQGKLKKISVEGGATIDLCNAANGRGGSWGEDGNIIATLSNAGGLYRIPSAGGPPTPVTELQSGERTHRWPQILPGGKAMLFTAHTSPTGFDTANIEVMSLADHHTKTLQRGGTFGRYLPSGHLIYVNRGTLFAVPFDVDRLEVRGTPAPVLDQVGYDPGNGSAQFDFSQTGTLVYRSGGAGGGLFTVQWLDAAGKMQPLLAKPDAYLRPSLSPDGNRLAIATSSDIWAYEWQRDTMTRLTFGPAASIYPLWSPDGRYIVFQAPGGMFWTRSDGSGKPQPLTQSKNTQTPWSFTADGKRLAFHEIYPETGFDLWTVPLESDGAGLRAGKPEPFLQTPFNERQGSFSPDGRWLAYISDESGGFQVYVRAFLDKGGKWQISNNGGVNPVWSHNGHELFFRTEDNQILVASYTVKGDSFVADKPRVWSEKRIANVGINANYDLAPDGKRIAALMPTEAPEEQKAQNHVIFLENFFDEVRRRSKP